MSKPLEEIEKTMESLEGIGAADPGPYFYTRLKARHQLTSVPAALPFAWKAIVSVIVLVNLFSFYMVSNTATSVQNEDAIDLLAADYFGNTLEDLSDLDYNYQLNE